VKGLLAILGKPSKDKGVASEDEAPASEPDMGGGDDFRSVMIDAAKSGDWEAFADAVKGYAKSCMTEE